MMHSLTRWTVGLAAALLAACGSDKPEVAETHKVDKIILFTVYTLRADQLGALGNTTFPTPNLDRFASESLNFTHAYTSASLTVPSFTSMFTGLQPRRHNVHDQRSAMAPNIVSIPAIAQKRGVKTASFITNICVLQPLERTVFHDGWDTKYCGMHDTEGDMLEQYLWDEEVINESLAWLEQQEGPFLLWVHLMDPHAEHRPNPRDWDYDARPVLEKQAQYEAFNAWEEAQTYPNEAEKKHLWDLYAAEVIGADRDFGRFMEQVDKRADKDEIAVIFASDHGEELYESWSRYDHGLSLSEGVMWVPLMVRVPGVAPAIKDDVVETLQVAPTMLELFNFATPYPLDGHSLLHPEPSRGFAVSSVGDQALTIRTSDYRYWYRPSEEPWTREEAPWRAMAPWFQKRHTLARYAPEKRTTVEYLNAIDPQYQPIAEDLATRLQEFMLSLGPIPVAAEQLGDEATAAELAKAGYLGYDGLQD